MSLRDIVQPVVDKLTDYLTIARTSVIPLFAVQVGYHVSYPSNPEKPTGWGARVSFGRSETDGLFYNGAIYLRVMLPFFIGLQIRWAGRDRNVREFVQTYIGWKLNGKFSIVFRVQSDQSGADGFTSPNYGQASGWEDGTK